MGLNGQPHVAIIGSGIAGIAAAIRLNHLGFEVSVFEAASIPGGKIKELHQNGFRFDTGPSLLTLPSLIDELFELQGRKPSDYITYKKLDVICKYFFPDQTNLTAFSNPEKFAKEFLEKVEEPVENIFSYLEKSRELYKLTEPVFLSLSLHDIRTYLTFDAWKLLFKFYRLDSFNTLHHRNSKSFVSQKTVQIFDRYATYNGSDPFRAPATMKVIPHLEYDTGAYFPEKGVYQVINALVQLAGESGVKFYFNHHVERILIDKKRAVGILVRRLKEKNSFEFKSNYVISNADVFYTYDRLLPEVKAPNDHISREGSSSALVFYWGMNKQFPQMDLHNIFFSGDYEEEFEWIKKEKQAYHDPTVYVNISSKLKEGDAPAGNENWFTMINVPHIKPEGNGKKEQDWEFIISQARKNIITKLTSTLEIEIEPSIVSETIMDPRRIESDTFSHLGSLYGTSSNSRYAAFFRHPNFSPSIKNLYFCGGSVHPGGGIPLCLMSAKIVAGLIQHKTKKNY